MGTRNNPGVYDCYSKAEPDEPVFVLLGRDPCAPVLINLWTEIRVRLGEEQEKLEEAGSCSEECVKWLLEHGKEAAYLQVLDIDICESTAQQVRIQRLEALVKQLVTALDVESSGSGHGELKRVAAELLEAK